MRNHINVERCGVVAKCLYGGLLSSALLLSTLIFSSAANAQVQELESIENVVVDFINRQHPEDAKISVELQRLDSRLKLTKCHEEMITQWSPGSREIGRTTVSVSCDSPKPWRIFVRAAVQKESVSWVLNTSVRKGDVLSRQSVSQQSVMVGQGGHFGLPIGTPIVDIEPWLGHEFAQAMQAGRIVGDQSLQLPTLVTKGDLVSIIYNSPQVAIKTKGVALESGALAQTISVKNTVSNKVFDAIVISRNNVAISP